MVQSLRDPSPVSPSSLRQVSTPLLSSRVRAPPPPISISAAVLLLPPHHIPVSILSVTLTRILSLSAIMSDMKDTNAAGPETVGNPDPMDQTEDNSMPSAQEQELAIKKKFGGLMPKKPPLISKDHERAYFDSADWALGKSGQQGAAKPKGPLEALRPKLQPTRQQQQRSRRLINTSSENEDGDGAGAEDMNIN
uniref:Negatively light-regulated protein n=1 Tax=Oryza glumipatula TaxID=40148 RepID=A0A0D9Y632_9ORYZ